MDGGAPQGQPAARARRQPQRRAAAAAAPAAAGERLGQRHRRGSPERAGSATWATNPRPNLPRRRTTPCRPRRPTRRPPGTAWPALTGHAALACRAAGAAGSATAPARELADELAALAARIARRGRHAGAGRDECRPPARGARALVRSTATTCSTSSACCAASSPPGLTELAEDDSWAQGQCEAMRGCKHRARGLSAARRRAPRATCWRHARKQQQRAARRARAGARRAEGADPAACCAELGELGDADRASSTTASAAMPTAIEQADSLESLAGVVREMVAESRAVQPLVRQTQRAAAARSTRAPASSKRACASSKTSCGACPTRSSTDAADADRQPARPDAGLRGRARAARARTAATLAVGLIDIDNFKKLNDALGHGAGDEALKSLAAARAARRCGRSTTSRASAARSSSCCCPARRSTRRSRC